MVARDGDAGCPPHDRDRAGDDPAPCVLRDGRLTVDDVDLGELVAELDGRAVWLLSHAALSRALAACDGPRTVSVGRVGPPVVLGMFAAAGWWARCHSPRELRVARSAGFPAERLVASGRVKDDGFLKDALTEPVGVIETLDAADADNLVRLAAFLQCEVPPDSGRPEGVASCALDGCGGLLAPVLHGSPGVAVDAPWSGWTTARGGAPEAADALHAWPLEPGAPTDGTLEGLTSAAAAPATPARLHGALTRGEWAFLPTPLAFGRPYEDPAWPTPETVMTRDGVWRYLEERALTD